MSEDFKAKGNAAFASKDFESAIKHFTAAIEASDSPNHVLYSNRSAAYASLKRFDEALEDANECVKINPSWAKGWGRKGAALHGKGDLIDAKDAYEEALKLEPDNAQNKSGLEAVENAIIAESRKDGATPDMGLGSMFTDPANIAKLSRDPEIAEYLKDPEISKYFKDPGFFQKNPMAALTAMQSDPRLMKIMAVLLGLPKDIGEKNTSSNGSSSAKTNKMNESKVEEVSTSNDVPMTDDISSQKVAANEEKLKGNEAYKAHRFEEAIAHYNKAYEFYEDITFLNNRAAVEFEQGQYEKAIETCHQAVTKGREVFADYKLIAKSFLRIGNAYVKMEKFPEAIEYFNRSLTEHRTPQTLKRLRETEKEFKIREAKAYMDPRKAEEAREEGKAKFSAGDWPGAIKAYTEMIRRAPDDPIGYSNRAAAYAKLLSFPEAINDCNSAIEKDPTFIRAYIRKANAYFAIKEYNKCIDACIAAKKQDKDGKSTVEIDQLQYKAMSARFQALEGETPEQTMERVSKDPEIVQILQDPVMNSILQQARDNPAALQDHMKNPEVARKIQILIAAGIIRTM